MYPESTSFMIGDWLVEPNLRQVSRPGIPGSEVRIDPKPMAVLVALVRQDGQVATRADLFDAVWPNTIVVEEALTRCISDLRKAFGESPEKPQIIQTIRGVGYRLLPTVTSVTEASRENTASSGSIATSIDRRRRFALPVLSLAAIVLMILVVAVIADRGKPISPKPPDFARVTLLPGIERFADPSPDGRSLVFSASSDGRAYELQIQDSIGGSARPLLTPSDESGNGARFVGPVWSSNGEKIAFMKKEEARCAVAVTDRSGNDFRVVSKCDSNYYGDLDWSPDGQWLAFSETTDGALPQRIVAVSVDGRDRLQLTDGGMARFGDHHAAYSPDGRRVAFVRTASEAQSDLFLLDIDSGRFRRITSDNRVIAGVDWMNDVDLVFASNRSGNFQLWQVSATAVGAEPRWLPSGTDNAFDPTVARQTGEIAFYHDLSASGIVRAEVGGEQRLIISNGSTNTSPSLSVDGRHLAYVSTASGSREIWIADADGSNPVQLTSLGSFVDGPQWSPEGRSIAFCGSPNGNLDVFLVDVESRTVRTVVDGEADDAIPRWSTNGATLYFSSDRTGSWQIWSVDVDGATIGDAVGTGIRGMAVVQDPVTLDLFVAREDTTGLRRIDEETSVSQEIASELRDVDWGGWDVTANGVYFLRRGPESVTIEYVARENRLAESKTVLAVDARSIWSVPWQSPVLDVSSDGSIVVFSRTDLSESEVVIVRPTGF